MYSVKRYLTESKYRNSVKEKKKKVTDENVSTTANVQGYNVPGAWTKDSTENKKKNSKHASAVRATLSNKTRGNSHMREVSYQDFKRTDPDNPTSPKHKIDDAIRNINRSLREVNKQINILSKYKQETGLGTEAYLASTKNALKKCNERSVKIMTKLKDLV